MNYAEQNAQILKADIIRHYGKIRVVMDLMFRDGKKIVIIDPKDIGILVTLMLITQSLNWIDSTGKYVRIRYSKEDGSILGIGHILLDDTWIMFDEYPKDAHEPKLQTPTHQAG